MRTELKLFRELKTSVAFFVEKLSLNTFVNKLGRRLALSLTDILTLGLFRHTAHIGTKFKLWQIMELKCSYKTLVVNVNRFFSLALRILLLILKCNRANPHLVKHLDSTDIPVCTNRKAKNHQVMKQFAQWGKTGKGWFYGLKLHLLADLNGLPLRMRFTSGNIDDRSVVIDLARDLKGIFVADAGYISDKLAQEFGAQDDRVLITKPRANMKKLASQLDLFLYSTRMRIEINFRILKNFFGLVTSLPRSVAGYLANYTYSLLAYCLR